MKNSLFFFLYMLSLRWLSWLFLSVLISVCVLMRLLCLVLISIVLCFICVSVCLLIRWCVDGSSG